jgi:staphyloferrin B biosynthesis citrate synthase
MNTTRSFRERLIAGELLLGTFIKTPTPHATEILGDVGYDFVVIDAEHAPFDRTSIDLILLGAKAASIAAIVRVPDASPTHILSALDDGADGVLVPHVSNEVIGQSVVNASRYRGGARGFSNSPRAGRYGGLTTWEHVDAADKRTTVIAMAEDPDVIHHMDALASLDGIDGFFLGRGDLTVALQAKSGEADEVKEICQHIAKAARAKNKPLCAHVGRVDADETKWLRSIGVTAFIVGTDQNYLRRVATAELSAFRQLK